jgi:hypothetical protein
MNNSSIRKTEKAGFSKDSKLHVVTIPHPKNVTAESKYNLARENGDTELSQKELKFYVVAISYV